MNFDRVEYRTKHEGSGLFPERERERGGGRERKRERK